MLTTKIKPSDINVNKSFMASIWQNAETEVSAYFLVKMAQKHGSWRDFTQKEIDTVAKEDFWFNKLIRYGAIKENYTQKRLKISEIVDVPYRGKCIITHGEAVTSYSFTDAFVNEVYRLAKK